MLHLLSKKNNELNVCEMFVYSSNVTRFNSSSAIALKKFSNTCSSDILEVSRALTFNQNVTSLIISPE